MAPSGRVFLSHNSSDKPAVEALAFRLREAGIEPWLDKWHLIPGQAWQPAIESALDDCASCAVFIGPRGFGPWQHEEMRTAINRRVVDPEQQFRVVPVLLPHAERPERSKLPEFLSASTWVEFRDTLDDEEVFRRLVCGIRGVEPGPDPAGIPRPGQPPFRGLQYFDIIDAPFFFGREALTEWLLNELRPSARSRESNRFLAIVGASGSGKSSLARAGLLAALTSDGRSHLAAICRPGPNPLEGLAVAVTNALHLERSAGAAAEFISALRDREDALHLQSRVTLEKDANDRQLVVLVDQFEEVFTLCQDERERRAFVANLLHASRVFRGRTIVVLTLRADFYGRCAAWNELAAALSDHSMLVGPMSDDELRRAIERPAALAGCELDAGLVDLLVREVAGRPGALPLLQDVLLQLWERREGRRLTVAAFHELGGIDRALERRANALFDVMTGEERDACRRVCLRLCQPGEGTEDTKRRAPLDELVSSGPDPASAERVVNRLAEARLLTVHGDVRSGVRGYVEITHEALIRNWPQLRAWLDTDRAGRRIHRRLTEAAEQWDRNQRRAGDLLNRTQLAAAREWAAQHRDELTAAERDLLLFSEIDHGDRTQAWMPPFADFESVRGTLAPLLESPDADARARGMSVLHAMPIAAASDELKTYLLERAVSDPSERVRHAAVESLFRHGDGEWLIERLLEPGVAGAAARWKLRRAIAHARNLRGIGAAAVALPFRERSLVLPLSVLDLLVGRFKVFATVFAMVYVACYLVTTPVTWLHSLVVPLVLGGAGDGSIPIDSLARALSRYTGPVVGAYSSAVIALTVLFLTFRADIDGRPVNIRKGVLITMVALVLPGLLDVIPRLQQLIGLLQQLSAEEFLTDAEFFTSTAASPVTWFAATLLLPLLEVPLVFVLFRHFMAGRSTVPRRRELFVRAVGASILPMGAGYALSAMTIWPFLYRTFGPRFATVTASTACVSLALSGIVAVIAVEAFRLALRTISERDEPWPLFWE